MPFAQGLLEALTKDLPLLYGPALLAVAATLMLWPGDRFVGRGNKKAWAFVAALVLLAAGALALTAPTDEGFNRMFRVDGLTKGFQALCVMGGLITIALSQPQLNALKEQTVEYYALILFSVCGMMLLVGATDLVSMYFSLELMALCIYVLVAYLRHQERSVEAGLKYFLLGAFSSGILLYGISLLFAAAGGVTTNLAACTGGGVCVDGQCGVAQFRSQRGGVHGSGPDQLEPAQVRSQRRRHADRAVGLLVVLQQHDDHPGHRAQGAVQRGGGQARVGCGLRGGLGLPDREYYLNDAGNQLDTFAASLHARYRGVVPEVASRAHLEAMVPTIEGACARAGVRLYELKPTAGREMPDSRGMGSSSSSGLHAKTFAVDGERIFIGSFNFDPRSALLNTEMGLVIDSPTMARALAEGFETQVPRLAYEVRLAPDGGSLQWVERSAAGEKVFGTEPETSAMQRLGVGVMSVLPIEWLL